MAGLQRKKNEDALLLALACGASVDAAAKKYQLSERTIYRRLEDPDFRHRLQLIRGGMIQRASAMLSAAAGEAVRTLLSLQKESVTPAVRLGAARAILEIGIKLRHLVDMEERLTEVERQLRETDNRGTER